MRARRLIILLVGLSMLCAVACVKEGENRTVRPKAPEKREAKPPPLPKVAAPEPVAAERVVDIFYTSNVAGDADPCG